MAGTMTAAAYHETPGPDEQYADPRESEQQGISAGYPRRRAVS